MCHFTPTFVWAFLDRTSFFWISLKDYLKCAKTIRNHKKTCFDSSALNERMRLSEQAPSLGKGLQHLIKKWFISIIDNLITFC